MLYPRFMKICGVFFVCFENHVLRSKSGILGPFWDHLKAKKNQSLLSWAMLLLYPNTPLQMELTIMAFICWKPGYISHTCYFPRTLLFRILSLPPKSFLLLIRVISLRGGQKNATCVFLRFFVFFIFFWKICVFFAFFCFFF